ncbi:MAG: metallophosphoesterase [Myxococcales bacterium]|nr:metallophosphoesterase [Myxococcales bacterium]
MKLLRLVISDLHLGSGSRPGELNPYEDFFHDDRFAELISHYLAKTGVDESIELILNGDIFDLLKIRIGGVWPVEITDAIATEKLRQCLDGHPVAVRALKDFMARPHNRITYLPGNHDLDMWFPGPQELLRRYIAPEAADRVRFVTQTDTYYLPDGIQIRHGHQLERIHKVDYRNMTHTLPDGREILSLPWGSIWILEVMNPMKTFRSHIDRIQPLGRFMIASLFLDPAFVIRFLWLSTKNFLRHRVFKISAWRDRIRKVPELLRDEVISLTGGYDEHAIRELTRMRGAHTLIIGHSHGPRYLQLPNGKTLVNTGTWVKMINLDLHHLGQDSGLTYAVIDYDDEGKPRTRLMRWFGSRKPYEVVPYAD